MSKSPDAFRTISEVAEWLGIQAHVLRFWESKFTQVRPVKRAGGRRYYRPADMLLLGGIKKLLHDDGLTIKGVQKILREDGLPHVSSLSQSLDDDAPPITSMGDKTIVSFTQAVRSAETASAGEPAQIDMEVQDSAISIESESPAPEDVLEVPSEATPETPDDEIAPEPTAPARPVIPTVDVADPPPAGELDVAPGPLSKLAGVNRLPTGNRDEVAAILRDLAVLHDRMTNVTAD
ncbi:MAG: MerR family transcriptional regulator [Paracoccaceae bacterium]|jgi:DNA-binding transcriptional MerR regulator